MARNFAPAKIKSLKFSEIAKYGASHSLQIVSSSSGQRLSYLLLTEGHVKCKPLLSYLHIVFHDLYLLITFDIPRVGIPKS